MTYPPNLALNRHSTDIFRNKMLDRRLYQTSHSLCHEHRRILDSTSIIRQLLVYPHDSQTYIL